MATCNVCSRQGDVNRGSRTLVVAAIVTGKTLVDDGGTLA